MTNTTYHGPTCNEENNTLIAVTERDLELAIQQGLENRKMRYTHLEVDPFTILGVIGGIIPVSFMNCDNGPQTGTLDQETPLHFLTHAFCSLFAVSASQSGSS